MKASDILSLFSEPLLPVLAVGIHVLFGHKSQWIDHLHFGRSLLIDDFVQKDLDRFCPPSVTILRKKSLNMSVFHITQFRRQSINRNNLYFARLPFERIFGEQRPA